MIFWAVVDLNFIANKTYTSLVVTIIFHLCLTFCCTCFHLFKQLKCLPSISCLALCWSQSVPSAVKARHAQEFSSLLAEFTFILPGQYRLESIRLFIFLQTSPGRWTANGFTWIEESFCNQLVRQTLPREQHFLRVTSSQHLMAFFQCQVCATLGIWAVFDLLQQHLSFLIGIFPWGPKKDWNSIDVYLCTCTINVRSISCALH